MRSFLFCLSLGVSACAFAPQAWCADAQADANSALNESALPSDSFEALAADDLVLLETMAETQIEFFRTPEDRAVASTSLFAFVGLSWFPNPWISVHAQLGAGWQAMLDASYTFRYHNGHRSGDAAGLIALNTAVEFHPFIPVLTIRGELGARSAFITGRAGLWRLVAGVGLGARIFVDAADLRAIYIGFLCRFLLHDDYKKVFGWSHHPCALGLQVMLGF